MSKKKKQVQGKFVNFRKALRRTYGVPPKGMWLESVTPFKVVAHYDSKLASHRKWLYTVESTVAIDFPGCELWIGSRQTTKPPIANYDTGEDCG